MVNRKNSEPRSVPPPSLTLWLTGLSGSGKSTIADRLAAVLRERGFPLSVVRLDGDDLREGLNRDLGFSAEDRSENIRRAGEIARLLARQGMLVLVTLISPFRRDRDAVRARMGPGEFLEVFVSCPLAECEKRDPKGLYRRARAGEVPEFTGISSPYEEPLKPELTLDTSRLGIEEAVAVVVRYLEEKGRLAPETRP